MPTLNIGELCDDPLFAQSFTLIRNGGSRVEGHWIESKQYITAYGVIDPMNTKDVTLSPEGNQTKGEITIYSTIPLYTSNETEISYFPVVEGSGVTLGTPDEIVYKAQEYKVMSVEDYSDFGYYKAVAIRKAAT